MNPMTNVKNIKKLSEEDLKNRRSVSWHQQYKNSAWIFAGGLPYDLTEGDIICVFSQYGEPLHINLVRDKDTGKSKGYCFICYADQRSTDLAVDNLNGIKILGRTIRVDHVENYVAPKHGKDENLLDMNSKVKTERKCLEEIKPKANKCEQKKRCCSSESSISPSTESDSDSYSSDDSCCPKHSPYKAKCSSSSYSSSGSASSVTSDTSDDNCKKKDCKQKCSKDVFGPKKNIKLDNDFSKCKTTKNKADKRTERKKKERKQSKKESKRKSKRLKKDTKVKSSKSVLDSDCDTKEGNKKRKLTPEKNDRVKKNEEGKDSISICEHNGKKKKETLQESEENKNSAKKRKEKNYFSDNSSEDNDNYKNKTKCEGKHRKLKRSTIIEDLKREARLIQNELKRRQTIDLNSKKPRKCPEKEENCRRNERSRSRDGFREKKQNSSRERKREDQRLQRSGSHGRRHEKRKERSRSPVNYVRRSRSAERYYERCQKKY